MQICFIRDSVSLVMPVTPDTYQWTVGKRIETININALGDVYRPGGMTRFSGNLDFLLPAQDYAKDDCCTHDGHVWRSGQDNNVWTPGTAGAKWNDLGEIEEVMEAG